MNNKLHIICLCLVSWLAVSTHTLCHAQTKTIKLTKIDGQIVQAKNISAITDGKVTYNGQSIELANLQLIDCGISIDTPPANAIRVFMVDGGVIIAKQVSITNEQCTIEWASKEKIILPIKAIQGLLFAKYKLNTKGQPDLNAGFLAALNEREAKSDKLFVIQKEDKNIITVKGALEAIDLDKVTFNWKDKARKLGREKVYAMTFGTPSNKPTLVGKGLVHLKDGSSIWGQLINMQGDLLVIKRTDGGEMPLPWQHVSRIENRSDRLVYLSDIEPQMVSDKALFTLTGWNRDANWLGQPITLRKKVYRKGLGVHAPCTMVFLADGQYDIFAATIGIDDAVKLRDPQHPEGDCVFIIKADSKRVYEKRIRRADAAVDVRVSIKGARHVSLVVEAGENFDLGDHANWADARLIKEK